MDEWAHAYVQSLAWLADCEAAEKNAALVYGPETAACRALHDLTENAKQHVRVYTGLAPKEP